MNLSHWEKQHFFKRVDFCIAGGGIVGLNAALNLRKKHSSAKILVLEKSLIGAAASSKNAGFACFGSASEILDDIQNFGEETAVKVIEMRWEGLKLLEKTLGKKNIELRINGGYELFTGQDDTLFEACAGQLGNLNRATRFIGKKVYRIIKGDEFHFKGIKHLIENKFEGQINTGLMYFNLEKKCLSENILVLRGMSVQQFSDTGTKVSIELDNTYHFNAKRLFISNNGFASQLIKNAAVEPARAQVLVTEPIKDLPFAGTFHYNKGYYYFRNIGDRVLIGGGRNSDFTTEKTYQQEITASIQENIEKLLFDVVLGRKVKIESRWAGIMGVGPTKFPIIENISENVHIGVRMGGMGVAIGSLVGKKLAELGM